MRRQENRDRRILLCQRPDHFSRACSRQWIERTRRFVKQKHEWIRQHCARYSQALLVSG
jgi:hypothetical protein